MCLFDVVSFFTNVPLEEVINICADALYRNDDIEPVITTLTESSFKELMRLVTSGVEFSFNGTMFRQIDGVAMGSPLGPKPSLTFSLASLRRRSPLTSGHSCMMTLMTFFRFCQQG